MEGVAPGSLSAYSVLYKAGVRCFDADFVQVGLISMYFLQTDYCSALFRFPGVRLPLCRCS